MGRVCAQEATAQQIKVAQEGGLPDQGWMPCQVAVSELATRAFAGDGERTPPRTCQQLGQECRMIGHIASAV